MTIQKLRTVKSIMTMQRIVAWHNTVLDKIVQVNVLSFTPREPCKDCTQSHDSTLDVKLLDLREMLKMCTLTHV